MVKMLCFSLSIKDLWGAKRIHLFIYSSTKKFFFIFFCLLFYVAKKIFSKRKIFWLSILRASSSPSTIPPPLSLFFWYVCFLFARVFVQNIWHKITKLWTTVIMRLNCLAMICEKKGVVYTFCNISMWFCERVKSKVKRHFITILSIKIGIDIIW